MNGSSAICHRSKLRVVLMFAALSALSSVSEAQFTQISGGANHTCAVTESGGARCWGGNADGQLGNGAYGRSSLTPTNVLGLTSGVRAIATGNGHSCALTVNGGVKCWGGNVWGQLGTNTVADSSNRPVDVLGLSSGVTSIAANDNFTCAAMEAGGVKCWGNNRSGQLGSASDVYASRVPLDVQGLSTRIATVALGQNHACALTIAGGIKCWGINFSGQLGSNTSSAAAPVDVIGAASGMSSVSAGKEHTCAVTITGVVKCWGQNGNGQVGDGTQSSAIFVPVIVNGLGGGTVSVAAGGSHTCALSASGEVKCWGYGYGGSASTAVPTNVAGLASRVKSISAGFEHTCAVTETGDAKCWGFNSDGALGNNSNKSSETPVLVVTLPLNLTPAPNAIVAEYYYAALGYFFMTSRDSDKSVLDQSAGWSRTSNSFYVLSNHETGTSPINRFYFDQIARNKSRGSHFYTLLPDEVASVQALNPTNQPAAGKPVNEGIDSYAYLPTASGACAPGQVSVSRLFRGNTRFPDDPNHRFTTSDADYNSFIALGWNGEGIKFCVPQ